MNPAVAFMSLTNNPETFLRQYPVRIYGDINASGQAQYAFENRGASARPGSVLGTLNFHTTESFNIRAAAQNLHAANAHLFMAHSIHMDVGVGNLGFYRLDGTGPSIMVTGQLSGCSFVVQPAGGNDLDVAHIQPAGVTGAAQAATLSATFPGAFVYGATARGGFYDGADRTVSIFGFRSAAGVWSLYAQKHDATTYDYRIRSVYRIHPNHRKL